MADKSAIGWTDATWNVVTGCTKVSPGCAHCYIDRSPPFRIAGRKFVNGTTGVIVHADRIEKPLHWTRPRLIFVNSLSDMFHEDVPREVLDRMFAVMALAPQHTFQVLTKRPEAMLAYFETGRPWQRIAGRAFGYHRYSDIAAVLHRGNGWPLPNVWMGVTIENARYTYRADLLRQTPAAVRFISAEPLLGSLYTGWECKRCGGSGLVPPGSECQECAGLGTRNAREGYAALDLTGIDWLIAGGESGPNYRPLNVNHARELRDACAEAGTAFFFKQVGGKTAKANGKVLDGREWCEMPEAA
jgi:protein gp37